MCPVQCVTYVSGRSLITYKQSSHPRWPPARKLYHQALAQSKTTRLPVVLLRTDRHRCPFTTVFRNPQLGFHPCFAQARVCSAQKNHRKLAATLRSLSRFPTSVATSLRVCATFARAAVESESLALTFDNWSLESNKGRFPSSN